MLLHENDFAPHPIFSPLIYWLFQIYFKVVHWIYLAVNFTRKRETVSQITEDLLLFPAVDLARMIWRKETTSTKVIEAYIARAELTNNLTNAIVQRNYEFAREQAKQIDNYIFQLDESSQEYKELLNEKPLIGIPFSVKDHIGVKGLKLTIGLPCFADNPACEEDAEIVKRLMKAGAIPFVYSNVPEGVMWIETENTIYGRTNNPYDNRKGAGGSSDGEGALLGSGASLIGLGSDIGGSIRSPAMFNGVFGLKPSPHLITFKGCVPAQFVGYQAEMASLGPLCRYAKDLKIMLKILVDPEKIERLRLDEPVNLDLIRVFYMEGSNSLLSSSLDFDVADALNKAVLHFQNTRSKSTIRIDLPLMKYCLDMWFLGLNEKGAMPITHFFTGFDPERRLDGWKELPKYLAGTSVHVLPVIIWCILYDFFAKFDYDTEKRLKMRETLKKQLLDLLGDDGILLYPSLPHSSYYHNEPIFEWTHFQTTAIWNCMAFPVVSVPMGLNSDGMPTAIQVVSTPGNERLIIKVAEELSDSFGGWVPPVSK